MSEDFFEESEQSYSRLVKTIQTENKYFLNLTRKDALCVFRMTTDVTSYLIHQRNLSGISFSQTQHDFSTCHVRQRFSLFFN